MSASKRHSGLFSRRAHKSQRAFTIAATAKCMTPFSGPICQHMFGIENWFWCEWEEKRNLPIAIVTRWSIRARIRRNVHKCRLVLSVRQPATAMLWQPSQQFQCRGHKWMLIHSLRCGCLFLPLHKHMSNRDRCAGGVLTRVKQN